MKFLKHLRETLEIFKRFRIEQVYISKTIDEQYFWPNHWCLSFKHNLLPKWPLRIWKEARLPNDTR